MSRSPGLVTAYIQQVTLLGTVPTIGAAAGLPVAAIPASLRPGAQS